MKTCKLVEMGQLALTKENIQKFLDTPVYDGNRDERPKTKEFYNRTIDNGNFDVPTWSLIKVKEEDKVYRINGNTTANVLLGRTEEELSEIGWAVIRNYECEKHNDMDDLYRSIDSPLCSKSSSDFCQAVIKSNPRLRHVSNKIGLVSATALGICKTGIVGRYTTMTSVERADLISKYENAVIWLNDLLVNGKKGRGSKHLQKGPVAAVILKTYLAWPKQAEMFWTMVRDAEGPESQGSYRVLETYLRSITSKNVTKDREIHSKCIHAWNRWASGEEKTLALNYYSEKPVPELVEPMASLLEADPWKLQTVVQPEAV